jgi:pimeloyl-ACP methyl ester carboxylesterase
METAFRTTSAGSVATLASFAAGAGAPLVHFAHATGMCAGLYRPVLNRLIGRVNFIASDARGHGATTLPADPAALIGWGRYADDLAALLDAVRPPPRLILAGHSMGATVSMELAARLGDRVAGVVMIEPAFIPFAVAAAYDPAAFPNPMAAQAVRRRGVWPSRAAMREAYRGRGVFATWRDADLDAYLAAGVRDRDDGQVELACAPAWETATFAAVSNRLEPALAAWTGPLTLLHGTARSTVTPADAATIAARPDTVVRRFDGADHFLPLAEPQAMADAILARA